MSPYIGRTFRWLSAGSAGSAFAFLAFNSRPLPEPTRSEPVNATQSAVRWFLHCLPQRAMSRAYGSVCHLTIPTPLRSPIYRSWAYVFKSQSTHLSDSEYPLNTYRNMNEFFTRPLKAGCRPIDNPSDPHQLVSPVDGILTIYGEIKSDRVDQVKGISYSLKTFLGFTPDTAKHKSLFYAVFYLAPGDYHRIHSSGDWQIRRRHHHWGDLYPVNPIFLHLVPSLFSLNERVVLEGQWKHGFFSMAAVGALNVGSMYLSIDPVVSTNILGQLKDSAEPYGPGLGGYVSTFDNKPISATPGQELGRFMLGSTVVLVFESENFEFEIPHDTPVRMGQRIGSANINE